MSASNRSSARLAPAGLVAAALALLALVSALRMYLGYAAFGRPIPVADALGSALLEWGPWALLAPLAWRDGSRAILKVTTWCGYTCGGSRLISVERKENGWVVVSDVVTSVS